MALFFRIHTDLSHVFCELGRMFLSFHFIFADWGSDGNSPMPKFRCFNQHKNRSNSKELCTFYFPGFNVYFLRMVSFESGKSWRLHQWIDQSEYNMLRIWRLIQKITRKAQRRKCTMRIRGKAMTNWHPSLSRVRRRYLFASRYFPDSLCLIHQVGLVINNLPAIAGDLRDTGLIPGLGRSPEAGNGNPLQYSCLENPIDRGTWQATVHRITKSPTQLKWLSTFSWIRVCGLPEK